MTYDFKKEQKQFYRLSKKPELLDVPKMKYIAVRGKGDPNIVESAYQQAIQLLYGVAYTIKRIILILWCRHLKVFGGRLVIVALIMGTRKHLNSFL